MVIAFRGTEQFADERNLKSHIAQLIKSDNFGLVLGSGASVSAGGLVMSELWEFFKEKFSDSFKWLIDEGLIPSDYQNSKDVIDPKQIVGDLMDKLSRKLENHDELDNAKLKAIENVRRDLVRAVMHAAFLDKNLWEQSPEIRLKSEKLQSHIQALQKIKNCRGSLQPSPWIFTPNYDLAIEWAAESLGITINDGFYRIRNSPNSPRVFTPSEFSANLNGSGNDHSNHLNLIKLHGSLNWEMLKNQVIELHESKTYLKTRRFMFGYSNLPELLIFPGGLSYVREARPIHHEMLKLYESFFQKPNPVLFAVGYGFSDSHINSPLISAITHRKDIKVVIYSPEFDGLDKNDSLPSDLRAISCLENTDITIIGGGKNAYFDEFSRHLPDSSL